MRRAYGQPFNPTVDKPFDHLEGMLDAQGEGYSEFTIDSLKRRVRQLKTSYAGLIAVDLRQAIDCPDSRHIHLNILTHQQLIRIALEYEDGFIEAHCGGGVLVYPDGRVSDDMGVGFNVNEHGPLTQASKNALINVALGNFEPVAWHDSSVNPIREFRHGSLV
jgi:hypothetical protein